MYLLIILSCFIVFSVKSEVEFRAKPLHFPPQKELYEFWFSVQEDMTMTITGPDSDVLLWDKGVKGFRKRGGDADEATCGSTTTFHVGNRRINTGDGLHRRFVSINGSLPGPTLVVYQGSKVKVHVLNKLKSKGVIMHFHGMIQTNNFWHDGGGRTTQCPIMPGESFTYKFTAEVSGTYFYHSHFGFRGDGSEGPIIILPRENSTSVNSAQGSFQPDAQYVGFLQDWYPRLFDDEFTMVQWGLNQFYYGFENMQKCYAETKTFDGSRVGQLVWHSALINGRGWNNGDDLLNRPFDLPLETFEISKGASIAIRFIHGGVMFPFFVSVDDHELEVISADGHDIKPVRTNYLTIAPAERYTVIIRGLGNPTRSKYFIKVQTPEYYTDDMNSLKPHFTLGILKYKDVNTLQGNELTETNPTETDKPTGFQFEEAKNSRRVTRVFNCPFGKFPRAYNIECINYDRIRSAVPAAGGASTEAPPSDSEFQEIFLNVFNDKSFSGTRFEYPKAPPALFPKEDSKVLYPCSACASVSADTVCKCTHFYNVTLGSTLQIVLYNREKTLQDPKGLDAFAHPIHFHGNHFKVVAWGDPTYSSDGLISAFNDDILCETDDCNRAKWRNNPAPWPQQDPQSDRPMKDTIQVPVGGYVVIRIHATNPGWWMAHCHMLPHHEDGMALALKVGEYSQMPPKPDGFPICFQNY